MGFLHDQAQLYWFSWSISQKPEKYVAKYFSFLKNMTYVNVVILWANVMQMRVINCYNSHTKQNFYEISDMFIICVQNNVQKSALLNHNHVWSVYDEKADQESWLA